MKKEESFSIPYSLKSIYISNFKGINKIELEGLPRDAPWIFLTGENGFGKTSVLQAISKGLLLSGEDVNNERNPQNSKNLFSGKGKLKISIHSGDDFPGLSLNAGREILKKRGIRAKGFPYIASYGSSRLDTYSESSDADILGDPTENLFNTRTLLHNIELQLSRWYFKQNLPEFKKKYESVVALLLKLLNLKEIRIDEKTDHVYYIEQDVEGNAYEKMKASDLASGYRSLISMIGDMILRFFELHPGVFDPSTLSGIVIIDELDLHFHPKWQKQIPGILSDCFPKIQFIASTHSPIPLLGAPVGSVFLKVDRSKEEGITLERLNHLEKELPRMTPNLLLNSSIFGYAEIFHGKLSAPEKLRTEDTREELSFNDQIRENLKKGLDQEQRDQLLRLLKKTES